MAFHRVACWTKQLLACPHPSSSSHTDLTLCESHYDAISALFRTLTSIESVIALLRTAVVCRVLPTTDVAIRRWRRDHVTANWRPRHSGLATGGDNRLYYGAQQLILLSRSNSVVGSVGKKIRNDVFIHSETISNFNNSVQSLLFYRCLN